MKCKTLLCLALILSRGLVLKAGEPAEFVMELETNYITANCTNYCSLTNGQVKWSAVPFAVRAWEAGGELGWISAEEYQQLHSKQANTGVTKGEKSVVSPLGGREFRVRLLTDATKVPPEQMKAQIVVFQEGKPECQFDYTGFDDVDWVDEELLKFTSWDGPRAETTELFDVKTGQTIYRSIYVVYENNLEPPAPPARK